MVTLTREQRVVLVGAVLAVPAAYLVYALTGSVPLAGATLLGLGFVIPSGINGSRRDEGGDGGGGDEKR